MPLIHIVDKSKEYAQIKRNEIRGVNIGGAGFYIDNWINFDTRFGYEVFENTIPLWFTDKTVLPFADQSLDFVYSAHTFEHIDDPTADRLIQESFRCLRKGGLIMIVVPDFELALSECRKKSWEFIRQWRLGDAVVYSFSINNVDLSLENLTTFIFAGSGNITNSGGHPGSRWIYYGPPVVKREELAEAIAKLDVKEFSTFAVSRLPKNDHLYGHVNAYTRKELQQRLVDCGFTSVDPFGNEVRPLRDLLKKEASRKFKPPGGDSEHSFNLWHEISMYAAGLKV